MNTANDRHLQKLTCLAWTEGPNVARREQARAIGVLAAALRRWAGNALSGQRGGGRDGVLSGTA